MEEPTVPFSRRETIQLLQENCRYYLAKRAVSREPLVPFQEQSRWYHFRPHVIHAYLLAIYLRIPVQRTVSENAPDCTFFTCSRCRGKKGPRSHDYCLPLPIYTEKPRAESAYKRIPFNLIIVWGAVSKLNSDYSIGWHTRQVTRAARAAGVWYVYSGIIPSSH